MYTFHHVSKLLYFIKKKNIMKSIYMYVYTSGQKFGIVNIFLNGFERFMLCLPTFFDSIVLKSTL